MPTKEELLAEAYKRGLLNERQAKLVEELGRRGRINIEMPSERSQELQATMQQQRREVFEEMAGEVGPIQSFLVGAGRGFTKLGRGVGLVEPPTEAEIMGEEALGEERPITQMAGEIVGEAAPFVPLGVGAAGGISRIGLTGARALGAQALGQAGVGALEGGLLSENVQKGMLAGGLTGFGAEILFPVVGRMGRKLFTKLTGRVPKGSMLDAAGRPTEELNEALAQAGMSYDDLIADAQEVIARQAPGADPEQVARAALFTEEGIPITRGELTQVKFGQHATEQQLLKSAQEPAAEPLRQFKLDQSEAIKKNLTDNFGFEFTQEETGELMKNALVNRNKMLRTQKNELYKQAAQNAKDVGQVPVLTDSIAEALPDTTTMRRLSILDSDGVRMLNDWLTEYGVIDPTQEMVEAGFKPDMLTLENFDEFRVGLNQIAQKSDAIKNATGPITKALDSEIDNLANNIGGKEVPANIIEPLKEARATVRQLKTEFSPQATVGQLIGVKKDGVTQITEASKVYNKLTGKALPVENTRKVIKSLKDAGEDGQAALEALQSTTMLDLIDAGFGTQSRKISGVKVFNPIAFKNRIMNIGWDKINAIFAGNKQVLKSLKNIDKIAADITPPEGAVPKGSAPILQDVMNKLGFMTIGAKVPIIGPAIMQTVKSASDSYAAGKSVREALNATPETAQISGLLEETFPGIASALGIAILAEKGEIGNVQ